MAKTINKNKNEIKKEEKAKWDELKTVGFLTLKDIERPHVILSEIMENYKDILDEDEQIKNICLGLDKSYTDCVDRCLQIMSRHVEGEFVQDHKEILKTPEKFQNAKFFTGELEDDVEKNLEFQDIMQQYRVLSVEICSLTQKGQVSLEQRISSKVVSKKSEEDLKKERENLESTIEATEKLIKEINEAERKEIIRKYSK